VDDNSLTPPTAKRRRYQRGWVEVEGAKGRKQYVGRWRADDGSKPKIVLGYVAEMSLTEARARIEAHVRGLGSRPASAAHITFRDYWILNFKPRRKIRWSEPTEAGYDRYMNSYLLPVFGNLRLADIEPQYIAAFLDQMRKNDYARSVVLKVWTLLGAVLEDAVDDDMIGKNPMRRVPMPKTRLPFRPVLDSQLVPKVLKAVADTPRDSAILHIGVFCAMRPSEVFGLRWSSFQGDHFLIRNSAWEGKLLEDTAKTGERRVFVPPATRAAITRWRERCKNISPDALMFPSKKGTPISTHNFRNRVLAPLAEKVELTVPLTFQVLRRSHATRNQRTPRDAQSHLGHKSIVTTMNVYAQEIPESVKRMVEQDEAAILTGKKPVAPKMPPSRKRRKAVSA
jgi:integrase